MFSRLAALALLSSIALAESGAFFLQLSSEDSTFDETYFDAADDDKVGVGITGLSFVITDDLKLKTSEGKYVVVGEDDSLSLGSESDGSQVFTVYNDDGESFLYFDEDGVEAYVCENDTLIRLSGPYPNAGCEYYVVKALDGDNESVPSYPAGELDSGNSTSSAAHNSTSSSTSSANGVIGGSDAMNLFGLGAAAAVALII